MIDTRHSEGLDLVAHEMDPELVEPDYDDAAFAEDLMLSGEAEEDSC
jgi:hypothetical protein